jgi:hypothetical protein
LYENPLEPINVSSLVNELTNLNTIIEKFNINHLSRKLAYVSRLENNVGGFTTHKHYRRQTNKRRHKKAILNTRKRR